ncbi:MAG: hydrogenase [Deltaproteobacteria bacterium HGW-Deltaproteobacteria-8]|jgi:Ni,Fe-hydrogenase III large subunit|nr:MAG: hydrogenase [Deltaproteobacteria bacterium HGW-Deltaproteobacteria-8]
MSASAALRSFTNGWSIDQASIPLLDQDALAQVILDAVAEGQRVVALFGAQEQDAVALYVVLANDEDNLLCAARTLITGEGFASLTPHCPQVHLFEREIAEQFGLVPEGHPWLKPVRYQPSWTGRDAWGRAPGENIPPGVGDFYRLDGEEVHEVAVGPVHAGIIEPGHFRFQCLGEPVQHLEIALGYQHRGVEQAMLGGPHPRSVHYAETLAGDATVAHTTSYCQVLESLSRCQKTARSQTLRGIALELERLANHVGDLGAMAGDVGFLPTASYCGRIRGDVLNMTALLCGSRFGRGMIRPGGVGFDLDMDRCTALLIQLDAFDEDAHAAINLLWNTPSVMARFEGTGPLSRQAALELGLVGPAARASGLARDVRQDQPCGVFRFAHIPASAVDSGDVFARAYVRWLEIHQSLRFVREQLRAMPSGARQTPLGPLAPDSFVVALNEGWRGEVCHVALTDATGRFRRYKVVDASFRNWSGLAYALRGQQISDFPLCNKSFNLSYCGFDL